MLCRHFCKFDCVSCHENITDFGILYETFKCLLDIFCSISLLVSSVEVDSSRTALYVVGYL